MQQSPSTPWPASKKLCAFWRGGGRSDRRCPCQLNLGRRAWLSCQGRTDGRQGARRGHAELLDQFAADYPQGPHDRPQSMCPAFGSLRVGLRMRRVATILPFYTAAIREFQAAGRKVVGSAPVGHDGTMDWLAAIGAAYGVKPELIAAAQNAFGPAIKGALAANPVKGPITLSGYEGSELLVARLLIESGADVAYVGTACARNQWSDADRQWLEAKGVAVKFRASLEDDLMAMEGFAPDLAVGTTPVVQKAKERDTPARYFTNLISARPLMGPAGAGSLAGMWEGAPNLRPDDRAAHQKKLDKAAKLAKAEEMI